MTFDIPKHDFCEKGMSNFSESWGVSWYYGLVMNVKFTPVPWFVKIKI